MWPPPRSAMPSHMSRARTIGARRLTSSARSISSTVNDSRRPLPGWAALATRTSTGPASSTSRTSDSRSVRSHDMARPPVSAASGSSTSAAACEHDARAPAHERARDRLPSPPLAPVDNAVRPPRFMREPSHDSRGFRCGDSPYANTATVAVKPCRNDSPPTGPISPAAKKPAAGAPRELVGDRLGVVVAVPEQPPPAAVAGEQQRAGRWPAAERAHADAERLAQVAVGARRVARVQPHHLARVDFGAPPRPRRCPGRRPSVRARGSRPARSRAC